MTMDRVTGSLVAALGLLTLWGASRLPEMPGQWVGPGAFPALVGAGLVATGALIAFGVGRGFEEEVPGDALDGANGAASRSLWRAGIPVALLVFYAQAVGWLGFVPTAAVVVLVTSLALGARPWAAFALAAVAAPVAQLVFGKLLRVPLAPGLLPMPW